MAVLMSLVPSDEILPAPAYEPRPAPNGTELLVRETTRRISETFGSVRNIQNIFGNAAGLADSFGNRLQAVGASLASGWLIPTGKTAINGDIGPGRRFDWVNIPLAEVKMVKNKLGGTVNDVFLATVAGAVRLFLMKERDASDRDLEGIDFRVMAPVSVRAKDQRGTLGNQVAMWLAALPIDDPDAASRLRTVHAETENLKDTNQALGAATLVRVSAGAPATLVALGARLAANTRPFNMTVTNVPGPQFPLYLLDARVEATYALVPLWESHGVGLAMFSYDGTVSWGINGDYGIMPDLDRFGSAIVDSFAELVEAAENAPERKPAKKAPKAKKTGPKKRPPIGT
jgi:WS/DGAT/MGAT family acyltransferase